MAELLERCGRCRLEEPASRLECGVGQFAETRLCPDCRMVTQLPPGNWGIDAPTDGVETGGGADAR